MNKLLLSLSLISFFIVADENEADKYWSAPPPVFSQQYDWLKLNSGEWFKGEITSMYDDELEFESDEFNSLIFDWQDVEELRSRFDQRIRFESGEVKQGFLIVKDNHLIVISNGKEEHYPLSELLSITSAADERKELWDGKIALGIDVKQGNVDQFDYSASGKLQRRTPFTRLNADFNYSYSKSIQESIDTVITDTGRFNAYLDWFYSSKVFFRLAEYEFFKDLQQNIRYKNTIGMSVGYHLIDNKKLGWEVTVGPSFQQTRYYEAALESEQNSAVVTFGTLFDYEITRRIDFILDYQLQLVEENSGKRNSALKTALEFELNNDFDFDISFFLDRIAEPVGRPDEDTPDPNDYRLVLAIAYRF